MKKEIKTEKKNKEKVMVIKEKFMIAIRDIKNVASFLEGMKVSSENENKEFLIRNNKNKLTNAIQWLHNWGD